MPRLRTALVFPLVLGACVADGDRVLLAGTVEVTGNLGAADGAPVMLLFYERAGDEDLGCAGAWSACGGAFAQALVDGESPVRVSDERRTHTFALRAWRREDAVRQDVGAFLDVDGDGRPGPLEPVADDPDGPADASRETDCAELGPCIPIALSIAL